MDRTSLKFLLLALACCASFIAIAGQADGNEGVACELAPGYPGLCRRLGACTVAMETVMSGGQPALCGYRGREPVVCCPEPTASGDSVSSRSTTTAAPPITTTTTTSSSSGSKSEDMCRLYGQSVFQLQRPAVLLGGAKPENKSLCGLPSAVTFVIGGIKAKPREFPHMATIGFGRKDNIRWMCGGTLISERYVLTAAHCLEDVNPRGLGKANWVRVGDLDLLSEADGVVPQEFSVAGRIPHPGYREPSKYNDIALLRLDRDAVFDEFVRPACLHTNAAIPGERGVATGWGRTTAGYGPNSNDLQKVGLPLVSQDYCRAKFNPNTTAAYRRVLADGIVDSMLCAGEKEGGKDTCQGDSGGPLQFQRDSPYCMYSVIGVTSFGRSCAEPDSPAVYSRVSAFVPWIESVVWG